jgi:DNA-binding transcriptional LysR family regulator
MCPALLARRGAACSTGPGVARDQRATQILADIDETEAEIGNLVLSPRSHLRIGAPSEIGRSRIAAIVADFIEAHPGLSIELLLPELLDHIFCETAGIIRSRSENRRTPAPKRWKRITSFQ